MKTVCISDTHGRHERIAIERCDLLVHAGDMTLRGRFEELESFARWFAKQPATHKLFIAGNHLVTQAAPQLTTDLLLGQGSTTGTP